MDWFRELTNFYAKFLSKYSKRISAFSELGEKNKEFEWTYQIIFINLKQKEVLSKKPLFKIFFPKQDVTLTTDASCQSVSVILSQEIHSVMYLSMTMTPSDLNYSNNEKEALSVVWCMTWAWHILLGKIYLLRSYYKPLQFIFHSRRKLPKVNHPEY